MTTKPYQLAAARAFHQKRRDAGMKKITVWLDPTGLELMAAFRERFGSQDAAVSAALRALAENPPS